MLDPKFSLLFKDFFFVCCVIDPLLKCTDDCLQVYAEGKLGSNPFKKEMKQEPNDPAVLAAVMSCRGVGLSSARAVLEKFPSKKRNSKEFLLEVNSGKSKKFVF